MLKTSLIDYPGRVAAVAFLPGCNLRCPYCHNAELVLHPELTEMVDWFLVLHHLERRKGLLSGLVLSGGEPCLHARLPDMAAEARALGYTIKLDTNGTLPEAIAPVGADYIAMDIKCSFDRYGILAPTREQKSSLGLGAAVRESMSAIRGLGCDYEFRITCAPGIFGLEDAKAVLPYLDSRDTIWLQPYRSGAVLDPAWAESAGVYEPAAMSELLALLRRAAPKAKIRGA